MKLISMVDYVLELETIPVTSNSVKEDFCPINKLNKITRYAKFLQMLLTLGMFVPTDKDGNILEEPKDYDYFKNFIVGKLEYNPTDGTYKVWHEYQQALSNLIFEGYSRNHNAVIDSKGNYLDASKLNGKLKIESVIGSNLDINPSAITKYQI